MNEFNNTAVLQKSPLGDLGVLFIAVAAIIIRVKPVT